jgi:hypothetical protein
MIPRRHVTQHSTLRRGDALDLLVGQGQLLRSLFDEWNDRRTDQTDDSEQAVPTNWDRGTIGKLVLEHAAVWLAARDDIVRVLRGAGHTDLADRIEESSTGARRLVDLLHDASAGVQPMALAVSPGFEDLMEDFRHSIGGLLVEEADLAREVEAALGDQRGRLRGGKFLRKHAPSHPRPSVDRFRVLARLHTIYDRVRGFPWAESYPQANTKIAERYHRKGI